MADLQTFETRLQAAYDRYLEAAPTWVDAKAIAAAVNRSGLSREARRWQWGGFSPAMRLAVIGLIVLTLIGAVLAGGSWLRSVVEPSPTATTITSPSPSPIETPVATPSLTEPPAGSLLGASGTIVLAGPCLYELDASTGELVNDCARNEYEVAENGTVFADWLWSPNGQFGIGLGSHSLSLYEPGTGTTTPIAGTESRLPSLGGQTSLRAWSPASNYFVWVGERGVVDEWGVFVGTVENPRLAELPSLRDGSSWSLPLCSADESRAVVNTDEQHAVLANGDGTTIPGALEFDRGEVLALSPNGRQIAFRAIRGEAGNPSTIDVAIGDGFTAPTTATSFSEGLLAVAAAWSTDNSKLAIVTSDDLTTADAGYTLWITDGTGAPRQAGTPIPPGTYPRSIDWSPDGAHVLVLSQEPPESYRMLATVVAVADGRAVLTATTAVFSPDGRFAMYLGPRPSGATGVFIVELATGRTGLFGSAPGGLGAYTSLTWLEETP